MAEKKGKAGRPTKLTPQLAKDLAAAYSVGIGLRHASRCVGISEATVRNWIRYGKADPDGPFGDFLRQMQTALSASILRAAEAKQRVDPGWWLAHMDPKRWGSQSVKSVKVEVASPLPVWQPPPNESLSEQMAKDPVLIRLDKQLKELEAAVPAEEKKP